ncbi:MAG: class I SAM-dependent methyltransferase [Acidiferrobacteraceae bacterium]
MRNDAVAMPLRKVDQTDARTYDAWYDTPRGRWIGEAELSLLCQLVRAGSGATLLDVGCGTGWFTRRFAAKGFHATGLDPNLGSLAFARERGTPEIRWALGDARALPFEDQSFDHVISVAALCFMEDERQAVSEIVRVTRGRFAIGWLNRSSLLYRQKGHSTDRGAYHGARWHRPEEVHDLFSGLPVHGLVVRSVIFCPSGNPVARTFERIIPSRLLWGGLVIVAGEPLRA